MKALAATLFMLVVLPASAKPPVAANACLSPPPQQVVEVFMSADCDACWARAAGEAPSARVLRLDWIVPGRDSEEGALAVAAVSEAADRLKAALPPQDPLVQRQALSAPPAGFAMSVQSGLAWNGYLGLQLKLQRKGGRALPPDASGWLALVERVAAGEDGTPVARQLVRNVIGPLPLEFTAGSRSVQHLRAVTLPPNSHAERLAAVGWIARPDGQVLMAAQSAAAGCEP